VIFKRKYMRFLRSSLSFPHRNMPYMLALIKRAIALQFPNRFLSFL